MVRLARCYSCFGSTWQLFLAQRIYEGSQGGKNVTPGKYLAGMVSVAALLAAGLFSLTGCFAVGAMLPNIVPAFFALSLFLMLWPNGRSMSVAS